MISDRDRQRPRHGARAVFIAANGGRAQPGFTIQIHSGGVSGAAGSAAGGSLAEMKGAEQLGRGGDVAGSTAGDLNRVCQVPSVRVDVFPVLESYANVHHLVAEVSGALRSEVTLDALLRATFPGGSITGCPKLAAMALIRELESMPRRIYTGALGWCRSDLRQAEFAIAIRTAWAFGRELRFGVGGGIIWD